MNTIGWIMVGVFAAIVVKIMLSFVGAKRRAYDKESTPWRPPLPIAPAPTPSEKEQEHGHDKTVPTDRG